MMESVMAATPVAAPSTTSTSVVVASASSLEAFEATLEPSGGRLEGPT
jgi:hypothetical protein